MPQPRDKRDTRSGSRWKGPCPLAKSSFIRDHHFTNVYAIHLIRSMLYDPEVLGLSLCALV